MKKKLIGLLFILCVLVAGFLYGINLQEGKFINQNINSKKAFPNHFAALKFIHRYLKPETYLEIGVQEGSSINLSLSTTLAIGVDPVETKELNDNIHFFQMTSDDFFKNPKQFNKLTKNKKIDLTFIDGMHLSDFVLRDFINAEKYSHPQSIIILHDTLAKDETTSGREPEKTNDRSFWTGDVYKVVPILKKYRPDLKIAIFPVDPSGLCIITNLDQNSTILEDNYGNIVKEFKSMTFKDAAQINDYKLRDDKKTLEEYLKPYIFTK